MKNDFFRLTRGLIRALLTIGISLSLFGCYKDGLEYRDLAARYKTTIGHVLSLDCANHGAVHYSFEVNGRTAVGLAPWGVLNCGKVAVGDPVVVYYDPLNPAIYTIKDPRLLYEEERGFYIPVWLAVPLFMILFIIVQMLSAKSRRARALSQSRGHLDGGQ